MAKEFRRWTEYRRTAQGKDCRNEKIPLKWHSPARPPFRLAGFYWFLKDRIYRRLPLKPVRKLPEAVDSLANHSAGGQARFRTDSARLSIRVKLTRPADMDHMPATGQCGFDCYIGPPGNQQYRNTARFDLRSKSYESQLFDFKETAMRDITLNFPLYQEVVEVLIGLDPGARILPPVPFRHDKPVVVYGTSVTQGGCASRPGMCYTNILSRRLGAEFINLGFSGSGRGEPEVAEVIAGISSPALFVLDYEGNADRGELYQRTLPGFIGILRKSHPRTAILINTGRSHSLRYMQDKEWHAGFLKRRKFQKKLISDLKRNGDKLVFLHDGNDLMSKNQGEYTVDGLHTTDAGFMRIAESLFPVLKKLLSKIK